MSHTKLKLSRLSEQNLHFPAIFSFSPKTHVFRLDTVLPPNQKLQKNLNNEPEVHRQSDKLAVTQASYFVTGSRDLAQKRKGKTTTTITLQ